MVRRVLNALSATGFSLLMCALPAVAWADCATRLLGADDASVGRQLEARDLIELRDFGSVDTGGAAEPSFSISPDKAWLAMTLRRADVAANSYCVGVLIVSTKPSIPPRLLDTGGDFIPGANDIRGVPNVINGTPNLGTPSWSGDGKWLVYRRRDRGVTQIWRVGMAGPAVPLTQLKTDATGFRWTADGRSVIVSYRPGLIEWENQSDQRRSGNLYDAHFWTLSEAVPRATLPLPVATLRIDVAGARVDEGLSSTEPTEAETPSTTWRAYVELVSPAQPYGTRRLRVEGPSGQLSCPATVCGRNISDFWLFGNTLVFRQDGTPSGGGVLRLFRWDLGSPGPPKLLLHTTDAIFGCASTGRSLFCATEAALQSRRIVRISPSNGAVRTVFDPNANLVPLRLGFARRLSWTDSTGVSSYGDLVLPPDHKDGQKHPLIVVQYQSRGFLRGGTGDEYPIQLFASRGFAVLSFQKPELLPAAAEAADIDALQRINIKDWAERRRILRSLEAGVDAAIAMGAIDSEKIGITGLSDGSAQTQFAMLNSSRFKVAAMSTCCEDPSELFIAGTAYADALVRSGYPAAGVNDPAFWKSMSLAQNARSIRTPLLIQASDNEYRLALQSFSALRQAAAPVEMYVYPNEYHVRVEPAHRLAVYLRSVAWFEFWFGKSDHPSGATPEEAARWALIRRKMSASSIGAALPRPGPSLDIDQGK